VGQTAYLSLGSNLGDRAANLQAAIAQLRELGPITAISSIYETEPVETSAQPWFLNCVVAIDSDLSARELLAHALRIESMMGRLRLSGKGPRKIDIDILLYAESAIDEPNLQIPHPGMRRRRFVLEPLVEIAPDARHPVMGKTAKELLSELPAGQTVRRLESI
jgi:2-amino-4-hydroxy-6-hydroxymethyldihydropteridine diphosphokinase